MLAVAYPGLISNALRTRRLVPGRSTLPQTAMRSHTARHACMESTCVSKGRPHWMAPRSAFAYMRADAAMVSSSTPVTFEAHAGV